MASIIKRKKSYSLVYNYVDEKGETKQKWETLRNYQDALKRKAEVENDLHKGTFIPPNDQTVKEFLYDFVTMYMLGELMIAFRGIKAASGGAFGHSKGGSGGSSSGSDSDASFLSGGLAGAVGRTTERHAASSVTNQQNHTISQKLYNSSVQKGGDFANTVIGAVAKGSIKEQGTITGDRAAEAMTSYFGYAGKANAPQFSDMDIGGGRIVGKESIGGAAPTEFAMYNADQYMKPEGTFTLETAKDGSKWYKQTPEDTVQKIPYMDANGDVKYNETIVQQLPQIPRRKDRV